ncbi:protein TolQ [Sphingoaurantiacus capsulatus]|uniref:Tol-Pal system protein TolQ n=1 Tax=Sphingoaurantiacus capsulatus TaxID=1771310 RepID=A0ABV7X8M0_9SPHN
MNQASVSVAGAADLSPWALFLQSDIIVKGVMVGLLLASIWSWAIIIDRARRLKQINKEAAKFEDHFWASDSIDNLYDKSQKSKHPSAQVFNAGMNEWRRSLGKGRFDREGVRARLTSIMSVAIGREIDELSDRLNILATVGSVAPFVGLFGTVWGIMRAFTSIAATQNTTLAVVAPGIAEALFATAIGLFAAIPAVIGYNRLLHGIGRLEARLQHFAEEFHGLLSRQLDQMEEK